MLKEHTERSIRLQLMLTFAVCLTAAFITYGVSSSIFGQVRKEPVISYADGQRHIDNTARELASYLEPVIVDEEQFELDMGGPLDSEATEAVEPELEQGGSLQETPLSPESAAPETKPVPAAPEVMPEPAAPETTAPIPPAPAGSEHQESAETPQVSGLPSQTAADKQAGSMKAEQEAAGGNEQADKTDESSSLTPEQRRALLAERERKEQEKRRLESFSKLFQISSVENQYKIRITDLEGEVLLRSDNAPETHVDVHSVISNTMASRYDFIDEQRREYSSFYPVTYRDQKAYLIVTGIPQPSISFVNGESPLSLLSAIAAFIFLFYFLTQRKMGYIEELAGGLRIIATGELDYRMPERTKDELGTLALDMNRMAEQLQRRIEEERRAEQLKNELITNISHDLRTPLTLIIGYLKLMEDRSYQTPEQALSYASIAYQKAEKLKTLIDDLFEFTKLSNHDVPMHRKTTAMNDLLEQLAEEHVTIAEEQQVSIVRHFASEKLYTVIDPEQMIRVFENLLGNAIKYSSKPGMITIAVMREEQQLVVRISNNASELKQEELEQLFERFYRVDKARSSDSGGSGLGLAIAKSIVEAHGGTIWAQSEAEQIHFYVKLRLAQEAVA